MDVMDDQTQQAPSSTRFSFLQTFVQTIHASSDPFQIGQAAARLLCEAFPIRLFWLLQADVSQARLSVLAQMGTPAGFPLYSPGSFLFYERSPLLSKASRQNEPLLFADLHHAKPGEFTNELAPFVDQETRGCLCLPLWNNNVFEGILLVGLEIPLLPEGNDALVLFTCGLHLATALSQSRLQGKIHSGEQYLQKILDQVPEGVLIAESASGQLRYANPMAARILGMAQDELVGAPLRLSTQALQQEAERPSARSFWTFAVIRALAGETLHQMDTLVIRPDGTQVPVCCSAAPLRTEQGATTGAILILQDMTLQKHLESHKNAFLALASHELRTPLTAVLGYAEIIASRMAGSEISPRDLTILQTAARHITQETEQMTFLITEMLDLSALDHDQFILHQAPSDLRELLSRVIETREQTTQKHQITLIVDEQTLTSGCIAFVDQARLLQAFNNLVANAIKYSPQGGKIEVGLRQEGQPPDRIYAWVRDHGLGIAPSDLPHVFQRFYRSRKPDRAISGLGIGLYLTRQIIERHHGHIWVESTEGLGTTFSIILPLTPEAR